MRRTASPLALAILIATAAPGAAYPRPGEIERLSVHADGSEATYDVKNPRVSRDGRVLVFQSRNAYVPEDDNVEIDVYARDLETGEYTLVSSAADGTVGNDGSINPEPIMNGRAVLFWSVASNLVPDDTNDDSDVFIKDLETGEVELVSVSSAGEQQNFGGFDIDASEDGRFVTWDSYASNLVPGDTNLRTDIFLRDREEGTTVMVSRPPGGGLTNGISGEAKISADGSTVVFISFASNLVDLDLNQGQDVFAYSVATGAIERVNTASDGSEANHWGFAVEVDATGRHVVFQTQASNLVPTDTNGSEDTFVKDRETGRTERISVTSTGTEASSFSDAAISDDGRLVIFNSVSSRLNPASFGQLNVYVHDRVSGSTEVVSRMATGEQGDFTSWHADVSGDGTMMVFESRAPNLLPGDTNPGVFEVLGFRYGDALDVTALEVDGTGVSGSATFSGEVLASAADPADAALAPLGLDLLGARLVHRPEQEDLHLRLDLAALPGVREPGAVCGATLNACVSSVSASPFVYGASFTADGAAYEIRVPGTAVQTQTVSVRPGSLLRCDPACVEVASIPAAVGTEGEIVSASVPLELLGSTPIALSSIRAFASVGDAAAASPVGVDEVALGPATAGSPSVEIEALDGAGTVLETQILTPETGAFGATLDTPAPTVRARACLGSTCGPWAVQGE